MWCVREVDELRKKRLEIFLEHLEPEKKRLADNMDWEQIHKNICNKTIKVLTPIRSITNSSNLGEKDISCFLTCECGFQKKQSHRYCTPSKCSSYYH